MALLATYRAETGAGVIIKMDVKQIGYASGMSVQEDYGADQVYVVSSIMPQDNENNKFSCRINLDKVEMRLDELLVNDVIKIAEDVLDRADFNIEVIDLASGATTVVYAGCCLASRNHNIRANQISSGSMGLIALDTVATVATVASV